MRPYRQASSSPAVYAYPAGVEGSEQGPLPPDYSFVPRCEPPFISALAAEDRCHLNGLALAAAGTAVAPKYVTALGATDIAGGWRPEKAKGGCLIDVPSGEVVVRGLSMPHSPRLHEGRLWLLESGTGRLLLVEEIFDVQGLPGLRFPEVIGFQKDDIHNTFIVPAENRSLSRP